MNPKKNLHVLMIVMVIGQRILKTYINEMTERDNAHKTGDEEDGTAFDNQIILQMASNLDKEAPAMFSNVNVTAGHVTIKNCIKNGLTLEYSFCSHQKNVKFLQ